MNYMQYYYSFVFLQGGLWPGTRGACRNWTRPWLSLQKENLWYVSDVISFSSDIASLAWLLSFDTDFMIENGDDADNDADDDEYNFWFF